MMPRPKTDPGTRGRWAESVARDFLEAEGLEPVCENYRWCRGEIDLIMRDGETVVFVEVRYRKADRFGSGAETVTLVKQHRVIATARHYLQHTADMESHPCRFDVVAISNGARTPKVEWIRDAFEA
jgi:putative endonuclease